MFIFLFIINFFLFLLIIPFSNAQGIAVSPSSLVVEGVSGETVSRQLLLFNPSTHPVNYKLTVKNNPELFIIATEGTLQKESKEIITFSVTMPDKEIEDAFIINAYSSQNGKDISLSPGVSIPITLKSKRGEETQTTSWLTKRNITIGITAVLFVILVLYILFSDQKKSKKKK